MFAEESLGFCYGGCEQFAFELEKDFNELLNVIRQELANRALSKEQCLKLKVELADLYLEYLEQKEGIRHSLF